MAGWEAEVKGLRGQVWRVLFPGGVAGTPCHGAGKPDGPWAVLLTGDLCGLRTAPRCEQVQHHMQDYDPEDPREPSNQLPTQPTILRQTRHHVGTALSASAPPSGPWGQSQASAHPHPHPPTPTQTPGQGLQPMLSCFWPADPLVDLDIVPHARWGAASCMACGPEWLLGGAFLLGQRVLCAALKPTGFLGGGAGVGGEARWSRSAGCGTPQVR